MIHDHAAQARRVHAAMRKHGHHHPVHYHDGGVKVVHGPLKQPEYKSKLALHTNHNPGIAGSDEVMR